jgi:hypothetical protein
MYPHRVTSPGISRPAPVHLCPSHWTIRIVQCVNRAGQNCIGTIDVGINLLKDIILAKVFDDGFCNGAGKLSQFCGLLIVRHEAVWLAGQLRLRRIFERT